MPDSKDDELARLIEQLHHPDWQVAEKAAWALGEAGDLRAVEPLIAALDIPLVAGKAVEALVKLHDPRALEPLIQLFARKHWPDLATVLGHWGDRRAVEPLIAAMDDPDSHVRFYTARALGRLGDERALSVLQRAVERDTEPITDTGSIQGKSVAYVAAKAIQAIKTHASHGIEKNPNNHDILFVPRTIVSELARFLHPEVPYVWLLGHMPNRVFQWWQATVPVNEQQNITARVRMVSYDMQLRTQDFLTQAAYFDDHGLVLIQSNKLMPDTLDLSRIPEPQQDTVVMRNGGFLRIYLPHALETASVTCYQPGYLAQVVANLSGKTAE